MGSRSWPFFWLVFCLLQLPCAIFIYAMRPTRMTTILAAVCLLQAFCVLSQSSEEDKDGITIRDPIEPETNITMVKDGSLQNETIPAETSVNTRRLVGQTEQPARLPTTKVYCPRYYYPVYSSYRCSRICGYFGYRYYRCYWYYRRCYCCY